MGFPRQEHWSGLPLPSLGDLPDPRIKPMSPALAGGFFTIELPAAAKSLQSCPTLATPWTVARQAPLCMEFSRQEYWSGLPLPSLGDLPNSGIEFGSLALQMVSCIAGGFFTN